MRQEILFTRIAISLRILRKKRPSQYTPLPLALCVRCKESAAPSSEDARLNAMQAPPPPPPPGHSGGRVPDAPLVPPIITLCERVRPSHLGGDDDGAARVRHMHPDDGDDRRCPLSRGRGQGMAGQGAHKPRWCEISFADVSCSVTLRKHPRMALSSGASTWAVTPGGLRYPSH